MRFLFACRPFLGHLHPMMPLALGLQRDKHDVVFATSERFLPQVTRLGMPAISAGLDPRDPPQHADDVPGYGVDVIASKAADILAWAAGTPIDLIVREPTDFAGVFAAEVLKIPQVTLGRSHFLSPEYWAAHIDPGLTDVRAHFGLPADPDLQALFGTCYLDMVPSWFQPPGLSLPANRVEIGPEQYDGPIPGGCALGARGVRRYLRHVWDLLQR